MTSGLALEGKRAVVTGGGRGIGRAIALRFAAAGAAIGLVGRDRGRLEAVAAEIAEAGGRAVVAVADVSDSAAMGAAAAVLRGGLGGLGEIDLLVNNAGIVVRKPFLQVSDEEWRGVLGANLDGTFYATRAFGADLVARRGRIINIASIAGRQGTALLTAYCAAKHGVVGLTRALAEELRDSGVAVNCICPGSVDTEMLREGHPGAQAKMTPDDIARTALFLAAEAPAALTGACVDVFG
jgi:NAD(P)-dependent dehydrogenase (short-subunit alcohol dehydrogenase family)